MRKDCGRFVPSEVLDGIYDIVENYILIAANEDVHSAEVIPQIVNYMENHKDVKQFVWEDYRNHSNSGGMLIIGWLETNDALHYERFLYTDAEENYWEHEEDYPD